VLTIPATFKVTDATSTRADLAKRKELKFAIRHADIAKLRHILKGPARSVSFADRVSMVRSVYYDDYRMSAAHANVDGLGRREKLRIRWYDQIQPANLFYFERKWRHNRVSGKNRFEIKSDIPLAELSYREIRDSLEPVLPPELLPPLWQYDEPTTLVEYKREHFAARQTNIRFTIDYDIRIYGQLGKPRITTNFSCPLEDLVVLECKIPVDGERALRDLLYPFSSRITRCSKYVYGCQLLGLVDVDA
jgi:hypothetical protein